MILDLARERRIRANLAELRRLLNENPERAQRFAAWLAEQEEKMNEKTVTLRLPEELLDEARALVPIIGAAGDLAATRVTLSTVIRLALIRGLAALQEEFGNTDGAAIKKSRKAGRAK